MGQANEGDKFRIVETQEGSGYLWGKYDGGWIALVYTDFDEVKDAEDTQPPEIGGTEDPVEPDNTTPTEPETTPTEPETTPTEPETTPTEPETTPTEPETTPTEPETTPTEPETTPTEPETTPTEPETTPTEPETTPTEPEQTDPPETQKPAAVTGTVNVNEFLRVRSGPGTGYSLVEYLKPNVKVEILEQKTVGHMVWGRISNGWVSMDYIVLDKAESDSDSGNQTTSPVISTGVVVNASSLRIRSGPGTHYSIVGYLSGGTAVSITEKKDVGSVVWGKIENGWISLEYVKLDKEQSSENTQSVTGTVNVSDFLRIRTGPGTSYAVAGYLKPKESVTITERRMVGSTQWGKISNGWISMDYVVLDKQQSSGSDNSTPTAPEKVVKTIIADCLRIRSDAGTNNTVVGYLYYGAKVEILETKKAADGTTWGKVVQGWISMDYAK